MKKLWLIVCLVSMFFFGACQSDVPVPDENGLVEVKLQLPGYYALGKNAQTRATSFVAEELQKKQVIDLPIDSTLWLIYEKQSEDGTGYESPVLKPYIVRAEAGYNSLYACTYDTDADGVWRINKETLGAPLYLENEKSYRFRMLAPALPVKVSGTNLSITVDNGMYYYATDERYNPTDCPELTAHTNAMIQKIEYDLNSREKVQYVKLNPMVAQVARLQFKLEKGDNVYSLEMLDAGVEITGIQEAPKGDDGTTLYNWTLSGTKADTLVMERGNKRAWLRLRGDMFQTDDAGVLFGNSGILPTYAGSNSVTLLLNIAVNGVPTQYSTVLNGMTFWHGCSYNLNMKVSLKNNIVVMTWQNQSWVTDKEW